MRKGKSQGLFIARRERGSDRSFFFLGWSWGSWRSQGCMKGNTEKRLKMKGWKEADCALSGFQGERGLKLINLCRVASHPMFTWFVTQSFFFFFPSSILSNVYHITPEINCLFWNLSIITLSFISLIKNWQLFPHQKFGTYFHGKERWKVVLMSVWVKRIKWHSWNELMILC